MRAIEPASNTVWIDLAHLVLPTNARVHRPDELDRLAADMSANGQLQEIIAAPLPDGTYEVLAGVGRVLAAQKMKWQRIRAHVKKDLTPFEKLRIAFSENDTREPASPLYQAQLLQMMMAVEQLTEDMLGDRLGKSKDFLVSTFFTPIEEKTESPAPSSSIRTPVVRPMTGMTCTVNVVWKGKHLMIRGRCAAGEQDIDSFLGKLKQELQDFLGS